MITQITLRDKPEWLYYIHKAADFDCYHTWKYHSLDKSGAPLMFVYKEGDDFVAFPLVKREITGTGFYDLGCVYGFSGPVASRHIASLDDSFIENFKTAFLDYLKEENYVSVFSALHPFFNQAPLLDKFGGLQQNGVTVVIDLSQSIEEQRAKYCSSTLKHIKKAMQHGFLVREEKGPDALAVFKNIYFENMKRVEAKEHYLFDDEYFAGMADDSCGCTRIFIAYDGAVPIAASMVMFTNGIVQAHLIGTRSEYLPFSPSKFMADSISQTAREQGMRYFNLGGGLGFKNDSLLNWKLSFTHNTLEHKTWRFVVNPVVYQQLLDAKNIDKDCGIDFFPLYRAQ